MYFRYKIVRQWPSAFACLKNYSKNAPTTLPAPQITSPTQSARSYFSVCVVGGQDSVTQLWLAFSAVAQAQLVHEACLHILTVRCPSIGPTGMRIHFAFCLALEARALEQIKISKSCIQLPHRLDAMASNKDSAKAEVKEFTKTEVDRKIKHGLRLLRRAAGKRGSRFGWI